MALELHPVDVEALRENFAGDFQVRVTHVDGWQALGTHLPPKEKRGLVLIDPPFEERNEFERMAQNLIKAHKRWPTGLYALWYPIKDPEHVADFVDMLAEAGIPKILRLELKIRAASLPPRLHGTGMIVINPPFVLEEEMRVLMPVLSDVLSDEGRGRWTIDWVAGE